jgi:hypothetical protein
VSFKTISPVVFVLLFFSCAKPKTEQAFYSVDSLITAQVTHLNEVGAKLQKEAILDGDKKDVTLTSDDITMWSKELDIFRQLEIINKPVSRGSYLVDDGLFDPGSNLTVKAFTSLEALPVRSLRIFYQDKIQKPRKIEAVLNETTTLYGSARLMTMEFLQLNNKTVLTSYSIQGGQKMIMGDSVAFSIKGKIQFK